MFATEAQSTQSFFVGAALRRCSAQALAANDVYRANVVYRLLVMSINAITAAFQSFFASLALFAAEAAPTIIGSIIFNLKQARRVQ